MTILKPIGITALVVATAFISILTLNDWSIRDSSKFSVAAKAQTALEVSYDSPKFMETLPVLPLTNRLPTVDPTRNLVASLPELAANIRRFHKRRYYLNCSLKTAGGDFLRKQDPIVD